MRYFSLITGKTKNYVMYRSNGKYKKKKSEKKGDDPALSVLKSEVLTTRLSSEIAERKDFMF